MNESERLRGQLRRAHEGEAWHGPALFELLDGLDADQAFAHPLSGVHSIWEIVLHLTAWHRVVTTRLAGNPVELSPEQDWPAPPAPSDAAWQSAQEALAESYRTLLGRLKTFPEARLEETVPGKNYTQYVMVHGVVQHDLYHAGQIALLKKAGARIWTADR